MKHYKDCNILVRLYRRRWYLRMPIQKLWYNIYEQYKDAGSVIEHEIGKGRDIDDVLLEIAHRKMNRVSPIIKKEGEWDWYKKVMSGEKFGNKK